VEVLLRRVVRSEEGVSAMDSALSVDVITIGSAAANTIQLLGRAVALTHATVRPAGGGLRLRCTRGQRVNVNSKSCSAARLEVGDEIVIGGHRLVVLAAPAGFDCALQLEADPNVDSQEYESSFRTDLSQTRLSARTLSWLFLSLALVLGLLIPIHMVHRHRGGLPSARGLPDDTLWSAGPLSPAHEHAAGRSCGTCHQKFFADVKDEACLGCHRDTNDHVLKAHRDLAGIDKPQRCGSCHHEHLGEQFQQVMQDDRLCVSCHASGAQRFAKLLTQNVSGFGPGGLHPQFNVTFRRISPGDPDGKPFRQPLVTALEQSNLKFSHAQHLNPDKVTSRGGGPMSCSECHVLDADSDRFKPMTQEKTCAMGCHDLNFDVGATDRHLPHGNVLDAMLVIEDYFTRKYVDPKPQTVRAMTRRLPDLDRVPSSDEALTPCNGPPLMCARTRAKAEIENQFIRRGCVGCHVVGDTKAEDIHERFTIERVRITERYFPVAKFSHLAHRVQEGVTGDQACEKCHAARQSTRSQDLLLPDVERCLRCHLDSQRAAKMPLEVSMGPNPLTHPGRKIITTQCTSCHVYHPAGVPSPQS